MNYKYGSLKRLLCPYNDGANFNADSEQLSQLLGKIPS